jgi:hypothetical protein
MRVVFLSKNDWANMSYEYSKALNQIGVNTWSFKTGKNHPNYKVGVPKFKKTKEILKLIIKANVVVFNHSEFIDTGIDLSNKLVCVMHTGSNYRQNSKKLNKLFNEIVDVTFSGGDVLNMGAKNEYWLQPAIDTNKLEPNYKKDFNKPIIIAHYPSGNKCSDSIQKAINNLKSKNFIFKYDPTRVSWEENLKRVSECDIYIEALCSHQNEIPLYIYGISAIESSALGKITCARFPVINEYEKIFGKCGIFATNTINELTNTLDKILSLSKEDFLNLQKQSRLWAERTSSYNAIGLFLKNIFEKELNKKMKG